MIRTVILFIFFSLFSYKTIPNDTCLICAKMLNEDDYKLSCGHIYHVLCLYDAYSRGFIGCALCDKQITGNELKVAHAKILQKIIVLLTLLSKPMEALEGRERLRSIIEIQQQFLQLAIEQEKSQLLFGRFSGMTPAHPAQI